ncbi:MAG: ATP-binding protein [Lachnospiraceae bacterium]|nr:ATP-binding protein [Lachnospiraceae bacterium]
MALTNAQYDKIIKEYDARRSNALKSQQERLEKIRTSIPEYAALEDEFNEMAYDYSRKVIADPCADISGLNEAAKRITGLQNDQLISHGYDPSYLEPPYTCPLCKDTGYVDNEKCKCFKKAEFELLCSNSNIKELTATDNFASLREDLHEGEDLMHFKEAVRQCKDFVRNFDTDHSNLMLVGTVGTGKSFLSSCIAHELLVSMHSVLYFAASDFFDLCADNTFSRSKDFDDPSDAAISRELFNHIYECDLLILDDLGTELTNNFVCTCLFNCINNRHNRNRSTIISTNLELSDIHARYSDRIFSRLTGNYNILRLTGPDLRMKLRTANI